MTTGANGRLEAYEDGRHAGGLTYFVYFVLDGPAHALVAVHTAVEPTRGGKGVGGALVRAFNDMAGRAGVPVVPLCSYAARWAEHHPDEAPRLPPSSSPRPNGSARCGAGPAADPPGTPAGVAAHAPGVRGKAHHETLR